MICINQFIKVNSQYFMDDHRTSKLLPAQRLSLFEPFSSKDNCNPQYSATCRLLQISDQDYSFDPTDVKNQSDLSSPGLKKHQSNTFPERYPQRSPERNLRITQQPRAFPADHLGRTQQHWCKASMRFLSGEEVCVMKRERVLNLSNFLIIDQPPEINQVETEEESKNGFKAKPPKNVVSFIRRRNISYLKDQLNNQYQERKNGQNMDRIPSKRVVSPTRRINLSCQLKRSEQEPSSPMKSMIFERPDNLSPEMNCTSPSFRNRRMVNYIKYRVANKP